MKFDALAEHCDSYKGADLVSSLVQLTVTTVLFFAGCTAMVVAVQQDVWWLYALLLVPVAGLLVRLFIIQHDCGHGSFFKSRQANDLVGRLISVLTVTPYGFWKRTHNLHHAGSGNLERRGYGGIETLTVAEYQALSPRQRRGYRLYRNVYFLLLLATPLFVLLGQRFPLTEPFSFADFAPKHKMKGAWQSVMGLNLAIVVFYGALAVLVGAGPLALVALPVITITSWVGGWLFYIQHQFEDTYWDHQGKWSFKEAALLGSSYYVLHPVLQWFTGNIGMHHIHHLCAGIPNYRLPECLDASPELQQMNRLTLRESLSCIHLVLWDEERRKLVRFSEVPV